MTVGSIREAAKATVFGQEVRGDGETHENFHGNSAMPVDKIQPSLVAELYGTGIDKRGSMFAATVELKICNLVSGVDYFILLYVCKLSRLITAFLFWLFFFFYV